MSLGLIASTIYSQLIFKVPPVEESLEGKTYIVTGANIGLGLEAARNLVRLNASKVILAVRSVEKGEEAKASILESTGRSGDAVEVWPLRLLRTASVKEFAARVDGLERVDGVILNAAIVTETFELAEGEEKTIKTNVISNTLLALLLLPKLRESAAKFSIEPRLTVVVSSMYEMAKFEEKREADIFAALRNAEKSKMDDRYATSKLLNILYLRELQKRVKPSPVIINCVNPGICAGRHATHWFKKKIVRTIDEGGRTLVLAVLAGTESHGQYIDNCKVAQPSDFVMSEKGDKFQTHVYNQLMAVMEGLQPGISVNV